MRARPGLQGCLLIERVANLVVPELACVQLHNVQYSKMRCTDCAEIASTVPSAACLMASCPHVHSDSDRSALSGNSQASFTRCAATSGGKASWTPASRLIEQPGQSPLLEALAPLVHDPAPTMQLRGDSRDGLTIGEPQHDLRSHNLSVRRDQGPGAPLEFLALLRAQDDADGCAPHGPTEQQAGPAGPIP